MSKPARQQDTRNQNSVTESELRPKAPKTKSNFLELLGCSRLGEKPRKTLLFPAVLHCSVVKWINPTKRRKKSAAAPMATTNVQHYARVFSTAVLFEEDLGARPQSPQQDDTPITPNKLHRKILALPARRRHPEALGAVEPSLLKKLFGPNLVMENAGGWNGMLKNLLPPTVVWPILAVQM